MVKAYLIFLVTCVFSFHTLVAQKGCPKLAVVPDVLDVGLGKPANFTVFASTSTADWRSLDGLTLNWVVSSGTIEAGQGTNFISVSTQGLELNSSITASVEVGGLPASCPSFISSTVSIVSQNATASWYGINICMLENGNLSETTGYYNPTYGDTMVIKDNKRLLFREAFKDITTAYAASKAWYINSKPVTFSNQSYVKFGLPRILGMKEVQRGGEIQGVPVFVEKGITGIPEVIYIPVRIGCEFQPYQKKIN